MKFKTLYAATLLIASSAVLADPITITTPSGTTDAFNSLVAGDLPVTSVYTNNGAISQGFETSELVGQTLAFSDAGGGTIGQFSPLIGTSSTAGYGEDWSLDFSYALAGWATFIDDIYNTGSPLFADGTMDQLATGFDAIFPTYTGGTFEFFYTDLNTTISTKVLELELDNVEITGSGIVFNALVNFDWYAGGDSFVEDFFIDESGFSFYELATAGGAVTEARDVHFRADFNVDNNVIPTCVDAACTTLERETNIDLSGVFSVPEPTSIAILGLGLLGLENGFHPEPSQLFYLGAAV